MTPRTLILDGFCGNSRRWKTLQRAIAQRVGPADLFSYDTSGRVPIETLGARLADAIEMLDGPVNLVGFSMGGLVIRTAMLLNPSLPLHRAAFINSPHGGTHMARLLPLAAVRDMRPDSALVSRLRAQSWTAPSLVIWTPLDQMIIPASGSRWANATCEYACAVPFHGWPIVSRKIHRRIAEFLADESEIGTDAAVAASSIGGAEAAEMHEFIEDRDTIAARNISEAHDRTTVRDSIAARDSADLLQGVGAVR